MIRAPHFLAEKPAAAALPKGVPRPWWEGRPFVAAMILLSLVPLIYPTIPPIVDIGGHMGRYKVAAELATNPTPIVATATAVNIGDCRNVRSANRLSCRSMSKNPKPLIARVSSV